MNIKWALQNKANQCAVPRCKNQIGPDYLGLDVCWRCFDKHCDKPFLQRYARGAAAKLYVAGRFLRTRKLYVRTKEMGMIKLGDLVKMDPENCGAYSQFLKKGDGKIIGIHPMGQKDLSRTVRRWDIEKVAHLTVRCDNGLVIIIGPSRLVEINGFKKPEEGTTRKSVGIRLKKKRHQPEAPAAVKKKRVPMRQRRRTALEDLWGST